MTSISNLCLTGLLVVSAAPLTSAFPGTISPTQEKPQEFTYRRPIQRALGLTAKETHDLLLNSLTTQFGENEPVASTVAMRLRSRMDVAMAEEAVDMGAGPGGLRRRYLASEGEIQIIDPASVNEADGTWNGVGLALESPLAGTSVVYVPAAGQPNGFGRHFDAVALRESALPKLAAPMDWSLYLPPANEADGKRTAALGASWPLDIALLEPLIAPAGFMGWRTPKPKEGESQPESSSQVLRAFASGVGGNLQLAFEGSKKGSAEARLVTVGVDPDNGRFGQIEIGFELDFRSDREGYLESRRFEEEGEMEIDVLGGELEVRLKGVAVLNWGLDLDRPFSALVNAEETVVMTVHVLPESGETVSQSISMKGTLLNGLTFKELPLAPVKRTIVTEPR